MKRFYGSLSEKDKRRYAAIEALKLGHGGKRYICNVLGCDEKTITQGGEDIEDDEALALTRIRRSGGGRIRVIQ